MTISELINELKLYPENTPVLVDGYENGYEHVISVNAISVIQNKKAAWYNGEFDRAEHEHKDNVKAVILSRNRQTD